MTLTPVKRRGSLAESKRKLSKPRNLNANTSRRRFSAKGFERTVQPLKLPNLKNVYLKNQATLGRKDSSILKQHLGNGLARLCGLCGAKHAPGAPHQTHRAGNFPKALLNPKNSLRAGPSPGRPIALRLKAAALSKGGNKFDQLLISQLTRKASKKE